MKRLQGTLPISPLIVQRLDLKDSKRYQPATRGAYDKQADMNASFGEKMGLTAF
jgi:hypothetical protein